MKKQPEIKNILDMSMLVRIFGRGHSFKISTFIACIQLPATYAAFPANIPSEKSFQPIIAP